MTRWLAGFRSRLRDVVFRRAADRAMDEEIGFHLEMETERNLRAGLDPAEARRRARVAFGGVDRHRQELREGRRLPILEAFAQDLGFGVRFLRREPGLSLVAVVTIALGIGATVTVFSAMGAVLFRPLAVPGAERVFSVRESRSGAVSDGIEGMLIPYPRYEEYREATREIFVTLAAHRSEDSYSLRLADATVGVNGALTSGNYFEAMGVVPVLGRAYTSDHADEIVISHRLWTTRFGGDPDAVGRIVRLDGRPVVVVGIAPAGFTGATVVASQVWAPVGVRAADPHSWEIRMVPLGRLRPGVSAERAGLVVDALARQIPPGEEATIRGARLDPMTVVTMPSARRIVAGFFALLLGMALLVLLIAAANIAGVMLARGWARHRELAVRLALGAGRGRILRHLLTESLLLFAIGGGVGVVLAYAGTAWLSRMELPPQIPLVELGMTPDIAALAFAVAITGVTGVLSGLLPAVQASRPELVTALKSGTAASVGRASRVRSIFVGGQVALAVALLLTGVLFARSLHEGLNVDIGANPEGVVVARFDLGSPHDYDRERGLAFHAALEERVRALPGAEQVGLSQYVLLSGMRSAGRVWPSATQDSVSIAASYSSVSPGWFEAVGVDIAAGRAFADTDDGGAPRVAIINRLVAERLWPGQSPIGRILYGNIMREPVEIVGVTETGRYTFLTEEPTAFVFFPLAQSYRAEVGLHVRAPGAEAETLRALAEEVRALDPDVALSMTTSLTELVGTALFPQRLAARLVVAFGLIGLILAALGIYGVLAFEVARRTRELGVRRALGATRMRVIADVIGRGSTLAAAGCAAGVLGGAAIALAARSLLFGIRPLDPLSFTIVPLILFGAAVLASWLPARSASAIEPFEALRTE